MPRFLLKTEPGTFSWHDLVRDGVAVWDGVRNHAARNHLRAMQPGDLAFVYHSGAHPQVVGVAKVVRAAYPDPTADDPRWVAVDVAPVRELVRPVTLAELKADAASGGPLAGLRLLRQPRLSVVPLSTDEWRNILELAATPEEG